MVPLTKKEGTKHMWTNIVHCPHRGRRKQWVSAELAQFPLLPCASGSPWHKSLNYHNNQQQQTSNWPIKLWNCREMQLCSVYAFQFSGSQLSPIMVCPGQVQLGLTSASDFLTSAFSPQVILNEYLKDTNLKGNKYRKPPLCQQHYMDREKNSYGNPDGKAVCSFKLDWNINHTFGQIMSGCIFWKSLPFNCYVPSAKWWRITEHSKLHTNW